MIPDAHLDDAAAWLTNSRHRWVYDKLIVAQRVGVASGPQGVPPTGHPCIWRPIYNLDGMGRGAVLSDCPGSDPDEPGTFWAEMLYGEHLSTDAIVARGRVTWFAQAIGEPDGPQRFKRWEIIAPDCSRAEHLGEFVCEWLSDYSGPLNVETIGGRIIEVHLRLTADWVEAGAYDAYPAPARCLIAYPRFDGNERVGLRIEFPPSHTHAEPTEGDTL